MISGQNSKIWEYRRQRIVQKSTKSESENLRNRFGFFRRVLKPIRFPKFHR